jgi:hypothetical protein
MHNILDKYRPDVVHLYPETTRPLKDNYVRAHSSSPIYSR